MKAYWVQLFSRTVPSIRFQDPFCRLGNILWAARRRLLVSSISICSLLCERPISDNYDKKPVLNGPVPVLPLNPFGSDFYKIQTCKGPSGGPGLSVTVTVTVTESFPDELVAVMVYSPESPLFTGLMTSLVL